LTQASGVAVVGHGMVTSVGLGVAATWNSILLGSVGSRPLPDRIYPFVRSRLAHTIPLLSSADRIVDLATIAVRESLKRAGGARADFLTFGSSSAGFSAIEDWVVGGDCSPDLPGHLPAWSSLEVARRLGVPTDRVLHFAQACAASSYAIAAAADLVRCGDVDVAIAGGADIVTAPVLAGFESCRIHADVCRPFDVNRSGLVLGEAAAFLVLASDRAVRTHALHPTVYLSGLGLTCDAYDPVAPDPSASGILRAITAAHRDAGETAVDFICAHGTGTMLNDAAEARAIQEYYLGNKAPPVASYKGSLGHPQGAAGACGAVLCVQAMLQRVLFPTVGLQSRDPTIDLDIPTFPRHASIKTALSLASGSWGVNAAILFTQIGRAL
jgi:3-oxoacyl-(acyl-carrier-protein) synthase